MNILVTKHSNVIEFARRRYGLTYAVPNLSRHEISRITESTRIFGALPIPLVAAICANPVLRYYHLIIPNVFSQGHDLPHLLRAAYFQRFHVEELEEFTPERVA